MSRARYARYWIVLLLLCGFPALAAPLIGFTSDANHEQSRLVTLADNVRLYQNAPAELDSKLPTALLLYATPNGSTLEQTFGAKPASADEKLDWRFDIQHVA